MIRDLRGIKRDVPVPVVDEYVLLTVTPIHNVVNDTVIFGSHGARHRPMLQKDQALPTA